MSELTPEQRQLQAARRALELTQQLARDAQQRAVNEARRANKAEEDKERALRLLLKQRAKRKP